MAKITYQDKVDLYENANIQHINKVIADDMNEIKEAVNDNETKVLIAVSDTAPSECNTGDLYYNTTDNEIYVATATDTWSSTGTEPTENTIYILFDTKTTYSYDGNSLVSIGGGEDEIAISTSEPTEHEKLWINPNKLVKAYGTYISNTHGSSQTIGYSQEYINWKLAGTNTSNGYIAIPSSAKELHIMTRENDQMYTKNIMVSDLVDGDYFYDSFYVSSSNAGVCAWQYDSASGIHCLLLQRQGTSKISESTTKLYYK